MLCVAKGLLHVAKVLLYAAKVLLCNAKVLLYLAGVAPPGKHEATFHPFSSSVTLPTVSGNITSPSVLPTRSPFSTEVLSRPKSLLTRSPFLPEVLSFPKDPLTRNPSLFHSSVLLFFCPFLLPSFRSFLLLFFSPSVLLFFCLYLRSKYTIGTQQSPPPSASHTRTYSIYTENMSKQPPTNLSHPIR